MQSIGDESKILQAAVKKDNESNEIDKNKLEEVQLEYVKLVHEFFDSLIKDLEDYTNKVIKRRSLIAREGLDAFLKFKKKPGMRSYYDLRNAIFGPNEIRSQDWKNTFKVKSQKRNLEILEKKFDKLSEDTDW